MDEVNNRPKKWRALEKKRLMISRNKTENIKWSLKEVNKIYRTTQIMIKRSEAVNEVNSFRYLRCFVQNNRQFQENVKYRVQCS